MLVNFRPVTSVLDTERPAYPLFDPTIIKPGTTTTLLDGEWLEFDGSSGRPVVKRGTGEGTNFLTGPYWGEVGRTDVQILGKVPIIISGNLQACTRICDTTGLTVTGTPLVVKDVTIDGRTCRGLAKATGVGQHNIFAFYVGPGDISGITTGIIRVWIKSPIQVTI